MHYLLSCVDVLNGCLQQEALLFTELLLHAFPLERWILWETLSKTIGQLSSSRSLPNLQRAGLPLEVVSWSVKEVVGFLRALGLGEWTEAFLTHRIQGDVMFSLKEETLVEMGVSKIGDRLYLVDCLQSLYEELTSWKAAREKEIEGLKEALSILSA